MFCKYFIFFFFCQQKFKDAVCRHEIKEWSFWDIEAASFKTKRNESKSVLEMWKAYLPKSGNKLKISAREDTFLWEILAQNTPLFFGMASNRGWILHVSILGAICHIYHTHEKVLTYEKNATPWLKMSKRETQFDEWEKMRKEAKKRQREDRRSNIFWRRINASLPSMEGTRKRPVQRNVGVLSGDKLQGGQQRE